MSVETEQNMWLENLTFRRDHLIMLPSQSKQDLSEYKIEKDILLHEILDGIPEEELPLLFDPVKNNNYAGTGDGIFGANIQLWAETVLPGMSHVAPSMIDQMRGGYRPKEFIAKIARAIGLSARILEITNKSLINQGNQPLTTLTVERECEAVEALLGYHYVHNGEAKNIKRLIFGMFMILSEKDLIPFRKDANDLAIMLPGYEFGLREDEGISYLCLYDGNPKAGAREIEKWKLKKKNERNIVQNEIIELIRGKYDRWIQTNI